jgi:hypothetical protein
MSNQPTAKQSKVDSLKKQIDILTISMNTEIMDMRNKYEYLIDYLLDKQDIKQLKEVEMADEDMVNFIQLIGSYHMDKNTLLPVKIESIYKGWILNKEQSDLVKGELVYDNLELGTVTANGFTKDEVAASLKATIKALKPKTTIITEI